MVEISPVGEFLCRLYPIIIDTSTRFNGRPSKGRRFEDEISRQIYYLAQEIGFRPNPPRMTLNLPTISGNLHQFDASFQHESTVYLVECKNTRSAAKDYVYYFNSKILDYAFAAGNEYNLKGVFVCVVDVPESAWGYSIAYGMRIIDPASPPLEFMLKTCSDEVLSIALEELLEKISEISMFEWDQDHQYYSRLLKEYRFLSTRWRDEYE